MEVIHYTVKPPNYWRIHSAVMYLLERLSSSQSFKMYLTIWKPIIWDLEVSFVELLKFIVLSKGPLSEVYCINLISIFTHVDH